MLLWSRREFEINKMVNRNGGKYRFLVLREFFPSGSNIMVQIPMAFYVNIYEGLLNSKISKFSYHLLIFTVPR